jgi:hypothetical protein
MRLLFRLGAVVVSPVVGWSAAHPIRTAGLVAALASGWVVAASLGLVPPGPTGVTVTPTRVFEVVVERPAYPVAVLVGLGTFLFAR